MIAMRTPGFNGLLASALLVCTCAQSAAAVEIGGVKFEDTARVAGRELKLNGAGMRSKFIIKVYAAGLYLAEKTGSAPDILKLDGPRRVTLVMMRDTTSYDFAHALMAGLNNNVDKVEKSKIVSQISKFDEMFSSIDSLKKGDVLHVDWIPGSGTQCELNGKRIGELVPELSFYNAVLRIWIGDRPADSSLKPALLGLQK